MEVIQFCLCYSYCLVCGKCFDDCTTESVLQFQDAKGLTNESSVQPPSDVGKHPGLVSALCYLLMYTVVTC